MEPVQVQNKGFRGRGAAINPANRFEQIYLERDADWSVRASLATTLGGLPPEMAQAALQALADDADTRVQGPALEALARGPEDLSKRLNDALAAPDFALRSTAAGIIAGLGERRPADSAASPM